MNKGRQLVLEICYLVSVLSEEAKRGFDFHYYSDDVTLGLTDWIGSEHYTDQNNSYSEHRKLRTHLRKELRKAGVPLSKYNRISFSAKA